MSQITVKVLDPQEWETYRELRLASLRDAPDAFVNTAEEEEAFPDSEWQNRMTRAHRIVASNGEDHVGVASVVEVDDELTPALAQLFGLWVSPHARGTGVATALTKAAAEHARALGRRQLAYWVSTDNGPAVAFASGIGFRPTDERRPMRRHAGSALPDEEEALMVLALGPNRGEPTVTSQL